MDLGTAPQGEIPTVVLLGDTLTWVQPPLALLDMVDMLDSETAAEATALEQKKYNIFSSFFQKSFDDCLVEENLFILPNKGPYS